MPFGKYNIEERKAARRIHELQSKIYRCKAKIEKMRKENKLDQVKMQKNEIYSCADEIAKLSSNLGDKYQPFSRGWGSKNEIRG